MRRAYLVGSSDSHTPCRGGVGSRGPDTDYELEVGQHCNASPEMLAIAAHHDEIVELLEFLSARGGNLARIVLDSYNAMRAKLADSDHNPPRTEP